MRRKSERSSLKTAVENWIRAEFQFRFGRHAFTAESAEWFEDASAELREALTDEKSLKRAAAELGLEVPEWEPDRRRKRREVQKKQAKRSKVRKSLKNRKRRASLFDD